MVEIYPLSVFLDSPTSFRSQNVWTVDVLRVLEFGLSTSTPDDSPADWTISRAAIDSREWTIQERTIHGVKTIPGDFESIANVLLSLTSLRVDAFISDDRADRARFGLEIPHTRMTMRLDDGSSRMLDVGIPDPTDGSRQLVSSDDRPFIMAVPSLSLGCLRNPVTDLRQRQLFTISRPSVSRLAVESLAANGSRLEGVHASRTSAGWILSSPGSQPERSVFIEPLIQALTALRARRFLGPDERTNAEHCFHVALSGISGVVEDTQNVTVFRGGSKTWITFDASSQRAIPVEDPYQAIRAVMPVADPGTVPVSRPVSGSASSAP